MCWVFDVGVAQAPIFLLFRLSFNMLHAIAISIYDNMKNCIYCRKAICCSGDLE